MGKITDIFSTKHRHTYFRNDHTKTTNGGTLHTKMVKCKGCGHILDSEQYLVESTKGQHPETNNVRKLWAWEVKEILNHIK